MGKKKSVKKLEMDNQQPSTSSSSGQKRKMDESEIEEEQVKKKLKKELKSDSETQIQEEVEGKCFIAELPPEMLMKILSCLDVTSLLNSRFMNRRWNGMARRILKSKENAETVFHCEGTAGRNLKFKGKTERASLENFNKWFAGSKDEPLYTRFCFYNLKPSVFGHPDWIKFTCDFGASLNCLKLVIQENESVADVMKFVENLLLKQLPNLSEFGIQLPGRDRNFYSGSLAIHLFSIPRSTVGLANLKILHLEESAFSNYPGIVSDLLGASVDLRKIEPFGMNNYYDISTFQTLQSHRKLDCLQTAIIHLDANFLSNFKRNSPSSAPLAFKLKRLDLDVDFIYRKTSYWSDASLFLSHLFEGSKDSLRELTTDELEFLPDLRLPKFSRLTNLTIDAFSDDQFLSKKVFPSDLNLMEIFPVLQHLELLVPWTAFFPNQNAQNDLVSCFPNLKRLKITGRDITTEEIAQISKMCPHLKKFEIYCDYLGQPVKNFPQVGEAIWTHMKKLEYLDLKICRNSPENAFPALDSTFTGFSREYCEHLYDSIEIKKCLEKEQVSEAELEVERQNPSILDLKDLKYLRILLISRAQEDFEEYRPEDESDQDEEELGEQDSEYESESEPEETLVQEMKEITFISEEYAFKLMNSLTYEIKISDQD